MRFQESPQSEVSVTAFSCSSGSVHILKKQQDRSRCITRYL